MTIDTKGGLIRAPLVACLLSAVLFSAPGCDSYSSLGGKPHDNELPVTVLSNVPPENSPENLYSPLVEMSWTGKDSDGYITGFEVSWVTYHVNKGDSVVHAPFVTEADAMVIPFESSDTINRQRIRVRAIDNHGALDPVGAERIVYTRQGIPPETILYYPTDRTTVFVARESTPSWPGVGIYFSGTDEDGNVQGYSVRVDDGKWSPWQTDTSYVITPDMFSGSLAGEHKVRIRTQDDTFIIEETPEEITLHLIEPEHDRGWLLVDATADELLSATERPTDEEVDAWYDEVLDDLPHDTWDLATDGPLTRDQIGAYQYVVWHNDTWRESSIVEYRKILSDYLRTGGRLVLSGWDLLERIDNDRAARDSSWIYGDFVTDVLHVAAHHTISDAKLSAVRTMDGETHDVDLGKLFAFRDGLYRVSSIDELGPFAEPLLTYVAADSNAIEFDGAIVSLGYQNPNYRLVFAGFPLYYLTPEAGRAVFDRFRAFLDSDYYF